MKIAVLGAGAFGTALAVALARDGASVGLWARDAAAAAEIGQSRLNGPRLPGVRLPASVTVSSRLNDFERAGILLLAVPMQQLAGFMAANRAALGRRRIVACAKGIDLASGQGAIALITDAAPGAVPAVLTGPSFAADIAAGLPTALTIACAAETEAMALQMALSTPALRLYRTTDTTGAELGGALKNVFAIAAGIVMGAGLGDSARAALITRGFAEMSRFALDFGARPETLSGLAGLGDLILTCTSQQSRNFRFGMTLARGEAFDANITVEGAATAKAVTKLAEIRAIDMPIAAMVAALVDRKTTVDAAITALLSRPLKKE